MDYPIQLPDYLSKTILEFQDEISSETLADLLTAVINRHSEKFYSPLQPYRKDERGNIDDDTIKVSEDGIEFDKDSNLKGKVYLDFDEFVDNGCSMINKQFDHWGTQVPFRLSPNAELLTLDFMERQVRNTVEEF
jgi:hypothetical protein